MSYSLSLTRIANLENYHLAKLDPRDPTKGIYRDEQGNTFKVTLEPYEVKVVRGEKGK